jgi:hypothetical protein
MLHSTMTSDEVILKQRKESDHESSHCNIGKCKPLQPVKIL